MSAEQDESVGMLVDPGGDPRNVRHERRRLRHEVIGGKDRDGRAGVPIVLVQMRRARHRWDTLAGASSFTT